MFVSPSFPAKVSRGRAEDCPGLLTLCKEGTQADAGEKGCY